MLPVLHMPPFLHLQQEQRICYSISAFTAGTAYLLLQRWFNTLLPAPHVLAVLKHL